MDPQAHDDETVDTVKTLFDGIVTVGDDAPE
jgi:hypothetical protein